MTPAQFGSYIADDIPQWTRVARESNIKLD